MHYYYDKDHYGREHCYEVEDADLQKDKEATLVKVAGDAIPVWPIESWDDFIWDPDCKENIYQVKAITDYLSTGTIFPVFLITHWGADLENKYECVGAESQIDYDGLIGEYAGPHDYQKGPLYLAGDNYTYGDAIKQGMYALAELLEAKLPCNATETIKAVEDLDIETMEVNAAFKKLEDIISSYIRNTQDYKLEKLLRLIMDKEQLGYHICNRLQKGFSVDDLKRFLNNVKPNDKYFWVNTKDELCGLDIYEMRRLKHFALEHLKKKVEEEDDEE